MFKKNLRYLWQIFFDFKYILLLTFHHTSSYNHRLDES